MLQMTHVQIPLDHLHFGSPDPHIGPEKIGIIGITLFIDEETEAQRE